MTKFRRLVPLGAWCRSAYQCRMYSKKFLPEETQSGPLDWTITPFLSLSKVIREDINQDLILNPIDSYINRTGSVTCGYSGIIFQHDLDFKLVKSYGGEKNQKVVPTVLLESKQWRNAKSRYFHTLRNLVKTSKKEGNLYVRWLNHTSANNHLVCAGEDPEKIYKLLRSNEWLNNSGLLHITTEMVKGVKEPIKNPIKSISKISDNCWNCIIKEREGFNGDPAPDPPGAIWKGDGMSWQSLFQEILENS